MIQAQTLPKGDYSLLIFPLLRLAQSLFQSFLATHLPPLELVDTSTEVLRTAPVSATLQNYFMANIASRLETSTPFVSDLIQDIESGQIKIPQFQRRFVWKAEQALNLLDSIANNYPIGSLLLWRTTSKLAVERNIGDFRLPETDDLSPTDYVLDGQQRLTVIYSCLGGLAEGDGFEAGYDLEQQQFVEIPTEPPSHVLPLRHLFQTPKLLDFRTALRGLSENDAHSRRLDNLVRVFSGYKIPVVLLKELTVEEVCPIFERINSSGTRLSTYDLMVAATWSYQFDLNEKLGEIRASLEAKDFSDIEGDTVLKCMSAIHNGSLKKQDLFSLRQLSASQINEVVDQTKSSLLHAVDVLVTEFGINGWDFVPYEALIVIIAYVHHICGVLNVEQSRRLRQWFWRAALNERYRVGGEAFVTADLLAVSKFVRGEAGTPDDFGELPSASLWKLVAFRSNNSRSRAFALALAKLRPRNITNGATIDVAVALSEWNRKQFHHVYPRAFLARTGAPGEHNAIANICMLAASENRNVSDADPKDYLPRLIRELGQEADAVFKTNALPVPNQFDYSSSGYSDFLESRAALIQNLFSRLCNGDNVA